MGEYDEMLDLGFEEVKPKRKPAPPKKTAKPKAAKVELPMATEVAKSITDANKEIAAAMAQQNKIMKQELNKLVTVIKPKPKKMHVQVTRNSAGFMDSLDIDLEY